MLPTLSSSTNPPIFYPITIIPSTHNNNTTEKKNNNVAYNPYLFNNNSFYNNASSASMGTFNASMGTFFPVSIDPFSFTSNPSSKEHVTKSYLSSDHLNLIKNNEMNILMIDIELANPGFGPIRAIGCVLASYNFTKYNLIQCQQWIVQRHLSEYGEEGLKFWKDKASVADAFFNTYQNQQTPEHVAQEFREFLDQCWAQIPNLCLLVDDRHADAVLLNQFLFQFGHKPIHYDKNGKYQPFIYVSRDLMRGSFSMIHPDYRNLRMKDLYASIHQYWMKIKKNKNYSLSHLKTKEFGPEIKHVPVYDALQALIIYFKMEDVKRFFYQQIKEMMQELNQKNIVLSSASLVLPSNK